MNLKHLYELRKIEVIQGALHIGALATLSEIGQDEQIRREYMALA